MASTGTLDLATATKLAHGLLNAAFHDPDFAAEVAGVPAGAWPDAQTAFIAGRVRDAVEAGESVDTSRLIVECATSPDRPKGAASTLGLCLTPETHTFIPGYAAEALTRDYDRHVFEESRREIAHTISLAKTPGEVAALLADFEGAGVDGAFLDDNSDWRAVATQDIPFLFPGLPLGATSLLCGPGGVGKSTLARGLVLSCLTGRAVFPSLPCHEPGRVVVLSGEDSRIVFFRSILSIAIQHGIPAGEVDAGMQNLATVRMARPFPFLRGGHAAPEYQELRTVCRRLKPKMLVIDTARRYAGLADENDAAQVGAFMQAVSDIAVESGCAAVVLHHAAKHAEGRGQATVRGSSVFVDESRSCFTLARDGETVVLHHAKSNFGVVADLHFRLAGGGIGEVAAQTRDPEDVLRAVVTWLKSNPGAVLTAHGVKTRQGVDAKALLHAVALEHPWADSPTVARAIEQGLADGTLTLESRRGSNGRERKCVGVNTPPATRPHTPTPPVNGGVCVGIRESRAIPGNDGYDGEELPF